MAKATGHGGIDYPDFGRSVGEMQNQAEIMLSELAVRLGHSQVFENTGNILYTEDFDNGLANWKLLSDHTDELPYLSALYARFGYYSVKMHASAPITGDSAIYQAFSYPFLSTFGIEFSFLAVSAFEKIQLFIEYCNANASHYAMIDIRDETEDIYYMSELGVLTKLGNYNLRISTTPHWHTAKLVIDTTTLTYKRFMIDHKIFTISNDGFFVSPDPERDTMIVNFLLYPQVARNEAVWLDNIIITRNEPT